MTTMTNTLHTSPETLRRIFDLVCPRAGALRLAEAGLIDRDVAELVSWKGSIAAVVTDATLAAAGCTIEQVAESVEFMTATRAKITRYSQVNTATGESGPGYLVTAPGYLRGPAV
jgi:hypothetical protein